MLVKGFAVSAGHADKEELKDLSGSEVKGLSVLQESLKLIKVRIGNIGSSLLLKFFNYCCGLSVLSYHRFLLS